MRKIKIFILYFCLMFTLPVLANQEASSMGEKSLPQIVSSLTKNIKNPLKKAKVLAVFIAEHYERDGFIKKEKENATKRGKIYKIPYQSNLFETKIGDSYAFADLYQQMCQLAGLEAVVIEGYSGRRIEAFSVKRKEQKAIKQAFNMLSGKQDSSLERYKSAWNAVKIDDKWILVDTYWMIKGEKYSYKNIQSEKRMKRILKQNQGKKLSKKNSSIDMDFFDAKPKDMIKTHFPFDETYQLLKNPYSLNRFLNQ